jgi:UDP-glucose 4-epimerase
MMDVAEIMCAGTESKINVTGIRPGEKIHEMLVTEEEMPFTYLDNGGYYRISSMLPELQTPLKEKLDMKEYTSNYNLMGKHEIYDVLKKQGYKK